MAIPVKMLVACDLHEDFGHQLSVAAAFARRLGAELHVLHIDLLQSPPLGLPEERAYLDGLRERLAAAAREFAGGEVQHVAVRPDASIVSGILTYAEAQGADVIALGTHAHKGLKKVLLGSVTAEVIRHAACPVLTIGAEDAAPGLDTRAPSLLVPLGLSPRAREALELARRLAVRMDARLDLLHVTEVPYRTPFSGAAAQAREEARVADIEGRMRGCYEQADGPDVPEVRFEIRSGPVAYEIAEYAREHGTMLVVMAMQSITGISRCLTGSVSERVVRTAPCPVVTIKVAARDELPGERFESGGQA